MKKAISFIGWIIVLCLCVIGLVVYLGLSGCRFLGLLIWTVAGIISLFLLLNQFQKHHKTAGKIMLWILIVALTLIFAAALVTGIVISKAEKGTENATCDYLIVLGAGVNGTTPSLSLRERINAAYEYLNDSPKTICVVSGGQGYGEDITEAQCMFNELTQMGIPEGRIWQEDKATSTLENIVFSLDIIREKTGQQPKSVGIVSSDYHLYRAEMVAREAGITPVCVPAKTSWAHLHLNYFLREIFVVWVYKLKSLF